MARFTPLTLAEYERAVILARISLLRARLAR